MREAVIIHNLPAERTPPIGRDADAGSLRDLLLDPAISLVTLIGPGGMGKTTLALHVAGALLDDFPDGVHLIDLTPLADAALIPARIAAALGLEESAGQSLEASLAEYYRDRRALLLLDNFEHLLDGAPFVAALLRECPELSALATSREALRLREERVYPLPPLALPASGAWADLDALSQVAAVDLFVRRAQAVRPAFVLSPDNAASVATIVARLDGLPLAIELAAARVRLFPPKVLLERLDSSMLGTLSGGARDLPERQQTIRATIAWSVDLLEPTETRLFRRLGIFAGGFTLEAAEAVAATAFADGFDTLETLESLLDKSLIVRLPVEDELRFGLLETLRAYALDQLELVGETAPARQAHFGHYLALAEETDSYGHGSEREAWVLRLVAEGDNLRAALAWSLSVAGESPARAVAAVRLAGALGDFWQLRSRPLEAGRWLAQALAYCDPPPEAPPEDRERVTYEARLHSAAGTAAWLMADFTTAISHHRNALACYQALGDSLRVADTLTNLSAQYGRMADSEQAIALLNESLAISRAAGDRWRAARALNNLGVIEEDLGDDEAAERHYRESLALARLEGDIIFAAIVLNNVGLVDLRAGRLEEAGRRLEESLTIARAAGNGNQMASCLLGLGEIARRRGDYAAGRGLYREVVRLSRENEFRYYFAAGLHALAVLELDAGQAKKAATLAGAVGEMRERFGIRQLEAYSPRGLEGDLAAIREALSETDYRAAWEAGRWLGREEIVALAMAERPPADDDRPPQEAISGGSQQSAVSGRTAADPLAELTPREREVALLMARGMTNEQIADELFVTLKTVEKHAGNALGKLGFRSRVELAAWMAAEGRLGE